MDIIGITNLIIACATITVEKRIKRIKSTTIDGIPNRLTEIPSSLEILKTIKYLYKEGKSSKEYMSCYITRDKGARNKFLELMDLDDFSTALDMAIVLLE